MLIFRTRNLIFFVFEKLFEKLSEEKLPKALIKAGFLLQDVVR
jgi:hypothetical protein